MRPAVLVLEDGSIFKGKAIGHKALAVGEVVFNTSMTGYQEILTDPSYARQIVTLTYPHIGNTGVNDTDIESSAVHANGLIIKDLPRRAQNFRCQLSLEDYLTAHQTTAITGIDTRRLTNLIREKGAMRGAIVSATEVDDTIIKSAQTAAIETQPLKGLDLAKVVTTQQIYEWQEGTQDLTGKAKVKTQSLHHVVAYDFGIKHNILRLLADHGCRITVVPATTTAETVLSLKPDGIFLSNGPGDPEPCIYAIEAVQIFLQMKIPIFGICLGHQILALASDAKTEKMKCGHHGANHPVLDLESRKVMITSQNHGFTVSEQSLPSNLQITHRSLFDNTIQGLARTDVPAFGFQGHPEASPGPKDIQALLFGRFIKSMENHSANKSDNI